MGKIYKNGIVSPKGFDMSAGEPVDQREIVQFYTDLTSLNHCYPGIEVKIQELQFKKYRLLALPSNVLSNWKEVDGSGTSVPGPIGPKGDPGEDGKSAYEIYVDNGGLLTELDWLTSLKGEPGADGDPGDPGPIGPVGPPGAPGATGPQGVPGPAGADGQDGSGVAIQGSDTLTKILAIIGTQGDMWISTTTGVDDFSNPVAVGDGLVWQGNGWLNVGPVRGPQGIQGPQGVEGPQGQPGTPGVDGQDGIGIPAGGTLGQELKKKSDLDYDTEWVDSTPSITTFLELTDTPNSYTGNGGKLMAVNLAEDALEPVELNVSRYGANYTYTEASELDNTFVNARNRSQIIPSMNDATLGGAHSSMYIKDVERWFVFGRQVSGAKIYVFDDINDLTSYTEVDASIGSYLGGIEKASYDSKNRRILFTIADNSYSHANTIVKAIDISTLEVTVVIDYATGVFPGAAIVEVVGDYIYTLEGNYAPKINKFNLDGSFVTSIPSTLGNWGAHGITTDGDFLYVTTFINYYNAQKVMRVNLSTFTVSQVVSIVIPGAPDPLNGNGIFTNQINLVGDYIYAGTEGFTTNFIYKINKADLSQYEAIDVLKASPTSDLYFSGIFKDKLYYGGSEGTFGSLDLRTGLNTLYENPFPHSINEFATTGELILFTGFDTYPVASTGYVGVGRYFKLVKQEVRILLTTSKSIADIDAAGGNTFITKEWFEANAATGTSYDDTILKQANYSTANNAAEHRNLLVFDNTNAPYTITLDGTGDPVEFEQQVFNDSGSDITFVSSDNILGNNIALASGYFAYYKLIAPDTWAVSIGGSGGIGGGAVDSVNGQTGTVVLDYTDVGAAAVDHSHTKLDQIVFASGVGDLAVGPLGAYVSGTNSGDQDLSGYALKEGQNVFTALNTFKQGINSESRINIKKYLGDGSFGYYGMYQYTDNTYTTINSQFDITIQADGTVTFGNFGKNLLFPNTYDQININLTTAEIDAAPSSSLVTKEWVIANTGGGGVTDHGALTGLPDDDHPQYFNQTRGDARYNTITNFNSFVTYVNTALGNKSDVGHTHLTSEVSGLDGILAGIDSDIIDIATNYVTLATEQEITAGKIFSGGNYIRIQNSLDAIIGSVSPNGIGIFQVGSLDGKILRLWGDNSINLAATNDIYIDKTIAQIDAGTAKHLVSKEWVIANTGGEEFARRPLVTTLSGATETINPHVAYDQYLLKCSNATSMAITLNADGTFDGNEIKSITFIQDGVGQLTFVDGTVTIKTAETKKTRKQYSMVTAIWTSANEVYLTGDLELL